MKIHEYQAKKLFKDYGINVPKSVLCECHADIESAVKQIGVPCVIKAQVHSGARGKSGGVKLAKTFDEAISTANQILGMTLVSSQAGEKVVNKILVEEAVKIKKELYLSLVFDRANECISYILSSEGGMEIEELAKTSPEKIITAAIDSDILNNVKKLSLSDEITEKITEIIRKLYKLFIDKDLMLVEINPLVITENDEVIALDGKINIDDNALFRQSEISEMRDRSEENPLELRAQEYNLNYIKLDGTIGCMVNGAGLAMATMDIIKQAGKSAANFLDVGGGAGSEKIAKAFEILLSDSDVKGIFINIFGGILRCDFLAEGITQALKSNRVDIPVIVRLEGTNKEQGAEILSKSGLKFKVVNGLSEAVEELKRL